VSVGGNNQGIVTEYLLLKKYEKWRPVARMPGPTNSNHASCNAIYIKNFVEKTSVMNIIETGRQMWRIRHYFIYS